MAAFLAEMFCLLYILICYCTDHMQTITRTTLAPPGSLRFVYAGQDFNSPFSRGKFAPWYQPHNANSLFYPDPAPFRDHSINAIPRGEPSSFRDRSTNTITRANPSLFRGHSTNTINRGLKRTPTGTEREFASPFFDPEPKRFRQMRDWDEGNSIEGESMRHQLKKMLRIVRKHDENSMDYILGSINGYHNQAGYQLDISQ